MEESDKINRKKKLPSIPSNYVTFRQLQERWIKEKERKQKEKEKEEKAEPQQEQAEKETKVDERVNVEVAGKGSRKNGHLRRHDRENWKRVVEAKPKEEEIATGFAANESEDVEKEKKVEELKNEKKKWKKEKKNKKEEKARVDNEGEEVVGPSVNAPLPASVESNKVEKEVMVDEVHAPKLASVEKENVEVRKELKPRIIPRTDGQPVEIGRKFRAMSMKGEIRTGDHCSYGRQYGNFNHFGGNSELNRRYYRKFDRRRELNQRNEGMVWVKKGEVCDRNVSGIQSSSCSSKELD